MSVTDIVALIASLVAAVGKITVRLTETVELFRKMNSEGRTKLTDGEVETMVKARDAARQALVDEINQP